MISALSAPAATAGRLASVTSCTYPLSSSGSSVFRKCSSINSSCAAFICHKHTTRVFTSFGCVLHPKVTQQAKEYKSIYSMPWMFVDWFVPVYLLVSVLVLAGFGACLYFLEPGLQDAHKWSNKSIKRQPLAPTLQAHRDDDSSALI
ncbi:hypothetical protein MHYP_G00097390 [Metynnis hypsauchen]